MYRLLCDLAQNGKRIVGRCLSVQIASENWNSGSKDDPHVASIMLTREMLLPLAVFALLESGCREVWVTDRAAIGVEPDDLQEQVEYMKRFHKPSRRFAYKAYVRIHEPRFPSRNFNSYFRVSPSSIMVTSVLLMQ